jgi:predicted amidohydrolase YtcJ
MLASGGMAAGVDLVIVGDIFRCDEARSWARALAIEGDRIVAVGTEDQVRERVGPAKDLVTGSAIMPGFQDAHVHPAFAGRNLLNLNLDESYDQDSYLARIRAFADANPDRGWIVGGGWVSTVFASSGGPRRELLDAAVPDRPVFLLNTDLHAAWVNSRALELAGLDRSSPDPWDGYLVRGADGSPTGTLQEGSAYHVLRSVIPPPAIEEWSSWLRAAQRELHSLGITGWQDARVEPDLLRAYRSLDDAGELTMRVCSRALVGPSPRP